MINGFIKKDGKIHAKCNECGKEVLAIMINVGKCVMANDPELVIDNVCTPGFPDGWRQVMVGKPVFENDTIKYNVGCICFECGRKFDEAHNEATKNVSVGEY